MCATKYRDQDELDPTKKAVDILDHFLDSNTQKVEAQEVQNELVSSSVQDELHREPVVQLVSNRTQSRVLFITKDITALEEQSLSQLHFKSLATVFSEVHVLVLTESWQSRQGVQRLDKNVWVYTTGARFWWMQPFVAFSVVRAQLHFTDGFRPDIIVAQDPFESGLCGTLIASKYNREFQVHIEEDFFIPEFATREKNNTWRLKIAWYVLHRTMSVRTKTISLKKRIQEKYTKITDVEVLPRHYDIASLVHVSEETTPENLFPQFAFTVLFIGTLDHDSMLFRALDACRSLLQSPKIGLIVVGSGPTKKESQKRAEILGIQKQVVFVGEQESLLPYLQSAHILLCTDTTEASEEIVIKAAASGLPIICAETPLRTDLFTDGESAFLVQKEDTIGFSQKLNKFLNTSALRVQFKTNAKDVVKNRLHEDPVAFKQAYRDSIEGIFGTAVPQDSPVAQTL